MLGYRGKGGIALLKDSYIINYYKKVVHIKLLIIIIAIFPNLIGALTALFFTNNYCVGLKYDYKLAVIGYLKLDSYISQSYLVY